MTSLSQHWNNIYLNTASDQLGWYETEHHQTEKFLARTALTHDSCVFISGAGNASLVDHLHHRGCKLILNDISETALNQLRSRLEQRPSDKAATLADILWMQCDIGQPMHQANLCCADLWIDRAVLHFLRNEQEISRAC